MGRPHSELTPRLVNALYTEAMLLADEARAHFDHDGTARGLPPEISVAFSCESLKVTTRLMHSIAWLLNQKALMAGEIDDEEARSDARSLGYSPASDNFQVERFSQESQGLIAATEDLYYRLERLSNGMLREPAMIPAPLAMVEQLRQAF